MANGPNIFQMLLIYNIYQFQHVKVTYGVNNCTNCVAYKRIVMQFHEQVRRELTDDGYRNEEIAYYISHVRSRPTAHVLGSQSLALQNSGPSE